MAQININQFAQTPIKGQTDLQISKSGVLSGAISSNQSGTVVAGQSVILDPAVTFGFEPQFKEAAVSDVPIGFIIYDVKQATYSPLDPVQVAFFGGVVIYLQAADTIAPGDEVELDTDGNVVPLDTGVKVGVALDPGTDGNLLRIIMDKVPNP